MAITIQYAKVTYVHNVQAVCGGWKDQRDTNKDVKRLCKRYKTLQNFLIHSIT